MYPYDVLGVEPRIKRGKVIHPDEGKVREAWYRLMKSTHPGESTSPEVQKRFREVMAAGLFLTGHEGREYRKLLHMDLLDVEVPPYDAVIPPIERLLLEIALKRIFELIDQHNTEDGQAKMAAKQLNELPDFIRPEKFSGVLDVDALPILAAHLERGEFFSLKHFPAPEILWNRAIVKDHGRIVAGKVNLLNGKQRAGHALGADRAPHLQIELSLAWWAVADPQQRERAIYEALCCVEAKSTKKGWKLVKRWYDVTSHVAVVKAYGLGSAREGRAFVAALEHPETPKRLETWELSTGQLTFVQPLRAVK